MQYVFQYRLVRRRVCPRCQVIQPLNKQRQVNFVQHYEPFRTTSIKRTTVNFWRLDISTDLDCIAGSVRRQGVAVKGLFYVLAVLETACTRFSHSFYLVRMVCYLYPRLDVFFIVQLAVYSGWNIRNS